MRWQYFEIQEDFIGEERISKLLSCFKGSDSCSYSHSTVESCCWLPLQFLITTIKRWWLDFDEYVDEWKIHWHFYQRNRHTQRKLRKRLFLVIREQRKKCSILFVLVVLTKHSVRWSKHIYHSTLFSSYKCEAVSISTISKKKT